MSFPIFMSGIVSMTIEAIDRVVREFVKDNKNIDLLLFINMVS